MAKPAILLHICCAPDATYVIQKLRERYAAIGYFYNPNVEPKSEYTVRLKETQRLARAMDMKLVSPPYESSRWRDLICGLEQEPEGGQRCTVCFTMRLRAAAYYCAKAKIELFTTTLTVSPHKNARVINHIGREVANEAGVHFFEADFKKHDGFKKSVTLSRQFQLYRQNYCGCRYSKRRADSV